MIARLLPYLWYPLLVALAVTSFAVFLQRDVPLMYAMYLPIIFTGILVLFLEYKFPAKKEWRPSWADIKADAAFMLVVQILVPRLLLFFVLLAIAKWRHEDASIYWPHEWPLPVQIILVVLIVDFTRYWLHRACHHFTLLWRFHEVHHSPNILYLLNVGRFHPIEKIWHFCLDSLPFLILGVAPEVLAGYFLLYSVNGFFQHSNLQLNYGWMNYLVGSAETHRWHHAKDLKTASCNYGNTTIVWDLLFGTWYLPAHQVVDEIGITNKSYPEGFWAQMLAPFKDRPRKKPKSFLEILVNMVVNCQLWIVSQWQVWRLSKMARDPAAIQLRLLKHIIKTNMPTQLAKHFQFERIENYRDYIKYVPVMDYEALRPWVNAQINGGRNALVDVTDLHYVRTSGTTGQAKDIPLTDKHVHALRRIQRTAVAFQYRNNPTAFTGSILAITSPVQEGVLANGQSFGSASGVVARNTSTLLRQKYVVPAEVLAITDSHLKYMLILRLALARTDITYIGTANATTLLMLLELYRKYQQTLHDDLRNGTFFLTENLSSSVAGLVQSLLQAQPERAAKLQKLVGKPVIALSDLWPDLKLIVTWTCASAGIAIKNVRKGLSANTKIMELGYIASEFRGTITIGLRAESGFPTLDTHFFEFAQRDDWDAGSKHVLTIDQLLKGKEYYVIITTPSGLYRYFMNDVVKVTGYLKKTPLLKFVQKGKGVTSITGEKLYEAQALAAVNKAVIDFGIATHFFMLLADQQHQFYQLYLEPYAEQVLPSSTDFAEYVDKQLAMQNTEYASKRESARLRPLILTWLKPGTANAYRLHCIEQGQREGQFKIIALSYRDNMQFDLNAWSLE